jgi:trehalose 6-phosphate phosphatase
MTAEALGAAITGLARTPLLLVALDFDGVLAPIVSDPSAATPLPESADALVALAELPSTEVAVISGRALADLAALSKLPRQIHLVGSHGAEFEHGFGSVLTAEKLQLHAKVRRELGRIAGGQPGVLLEAKPASVAVHVRNAPQDVAERVLGAVTAGPASWPGVEVTAGKKVLELAVIDTSKGSALDVLRAQLGATAVFFAGDDVTDEKAFARLGDGDVGVKVGPGDTLAGYRVGDPAETAELLRTLLAERRAATGA